MAEATARIRGSIEEFGVVGAVGVAIAAGIAFYAVHEIFHLLFGVSFETDTIGSVALAAVATIGVFALDRNVRALVATFVVMFVTHELVMGYGGVLAFNQFSWSMPVAVVAAGIFFLAAGGLEGGSSPG